MSHVTDPHTSVNIVAEVLYIVCQVLPWRSFEGEAGRIEALVARGGQPIRSSIVVKSAKNQGQGVPCDPLGGGKILAQPDTT